MSGKQANSNKKRVIDYLREEDEKKGLSVASELDGISLAGDEKVERQHSNVFYQPFSEEICEQACQIFERATQSPPSPSSRQMILEKLQRLIVKSSTSGDSDAISLECLLYASRAANSMIANDEMLFGSLSELVADCYRLKPDGAFNALHYLLKNWNWNCQIGMALVGAIQAEDNAAKRAQLLSDMEEYIERTGDVSHELLFYRVKALMARGREYVEELYEIIFSLDDAFDYDKRVSNILQEKAVPVFEESGDWFQQSGIPTKVLAKQTFIYIKRKIGIADDSFSDVDQELEEGNTDEDVRSDVYDRFVFCKGSVEYYCRIIKKNKYYGYMEMFESLLLNEDLNEQKTCCIAMTYAQMSKKRVPEFNSFCQTADVFPEDFVYLLNYLCLPESERSINLKKAIVSYFKDSSSLLEKGIFQLTKFDRDASEKLIDLFFSIATETKGQVDVTVLRKITDLVRNEKSIVRKKIVSKKALLNNLQNWLESEDCGFDNNDELFEAWIDFVRACPPDALDGLNLLFWLYQKATDDEQKAKIKFMMGNIDVVS